LFEGEAEEDAGILGELTIAEVRIELLG